MHVHVTRTVSQSRAVQQNSCKLWCVHRHHHDLDCIFCTLSEGLSGEFAKSQPPPNQTRLGLGETSYPRRHFVPSLASTMFVPAFTAQVFLHWLGSKVTRSEMPVVRTQTGSDGHGTSGPAAFMLSTMPSKPRRRPRLLPTSTSVSTGSCKARLSNISMETSGMLFECGWST